MTCIYAWCGVRISKCALLFGSIFDIDDLEEFVGNGLVALCLALTRLLDANVRIGSQGFLGAHQMI